MGFCGQPYVQCQAVQHLLVIEMCQNLIHTSYCVGILIHTIETGIGGNVTLPFVLRIGLFIVCEMVCAIISPLIVM